MYIRFSFIRSIIIVIIMSVTLLETRAWACLSLIKFPICRPTHANGVQSWPIGHGPHRLIAFMDGGDALLCICCAKSN